jgi:hypothetical protein
MYFREDPAMPNRPKRDRPIRPAKRQANRGPGKRLTLTDRYLLLELRRIHPDWSYADLATAGGVNVETARLVCLAAGRTAIELMTANAGPMLQSWARASRKASDRGDHRPAKDWLLHAGSIDPLPETTRGNGPAVVIINSPLPGMPGYQVPVLVPGTGTGTPGPMDGSIVGENLATPDGDPLDPATR